MLTLHAVAPQAGTIRGEPVPDDQKLATNVRLQGFEEFDNLQTLDRSGEEPEVKAPEAQTDDHR